MLAAPAQIKQENGILIPPARRASLNSSFVKHSWPFLSIPAIPPLLSFPCLSLPCPGIIDGNSANGAVLFPANGTPITGTAPLERKPLPVNYTQAINGSCSGVFMAP